MNHRERFVRTLTGKPVDRVPFIKVFGGTNAMHAFWEKEHPGLTGNIDKILGFEGPYRGWNTTPVNFWMTQRGEPKVVEESETQSVRRWPDGTTELLIKGSDYHHQTVAWPVTCRADWERVKAKHLQADDPARFPANWAECVKDYRNRDYPLQSRGGVYGFAHLWATTTALASTIPNSSTT
jgi:hypothetical protein